jgi:magnesium-protoporphyrin O-methyltransferase
MTSCQCQGIDREFGDREARAQVARYRNRGAAGTTRELIRVLVGMGVEGTSLLDIGGGVGAIQHALLAAGVRQARSVEASSAYAEAAREEAERRGLTARIVATRGDFVELAPSIPAADIVTLDRVVCCYHDMHALVAASAGHATRLLGLVYPRDAWWLRPVFALGNIVFRLRRSSFRIYLHRRSAVEAVIRGQGLRPAFHRVRGIWQVAVFTA